MSRRALSLASLLLVVGLSSAVALAQDTRVEGKVRTGDDVAIPAGETIAHDLYVITGNARVDGTVEGDLIVISGGVDIGGRVTGDVLVASGMVNVAGTVDGDLRVGSGQVRVSGAVGEDVLLLAGQATVSGQVGEDLIFNAGQMTMDGAVAGSVLGSAGTYVRRGTIGGSEKVSIPEPQEVRPTTADRVAGAVRRYIALLAVGTLTLWLASWIMRASAERVRTRPLMSLGVGIVGLVGLVVAVIALIVAVVLVSIPLGLLGLGSLVGVLVGALIVTVVVVIFAFVFIVAFGAHALVGLTLGRLAIGTEGFLGSFGALALGLVVVVLLTTLPVLGGWLGFVIVLLGLGALLLGLRRRRRAAALAD